MWEIIFFILPFALTNIFASMSRHFKISILEKPIDFGVELNNHRLFGENKTIRGALFGILFGILGMYLISNQTQNIFMFNLYPPWLYGIIGSIGAVTGDLFGSATKRQIGIKPGEPLHYFDQSDWLIGTLIFLYPIINISFIQIFFLLTVIPLAHYIVKYIGYKLKIEKKMF